MNLNSFPWQSVKVRVTLFVLAIFLIGIWAITFYASETLHRDMEHVLGEQQFSAASFMAAEVNDELQARVDALKLIAGQITPATLANPAALQSMLEDKRFIDSLFNNGVAVAGTDGTVIADFPHLPGRIGANFKETDYAIGPLQHGRVSIGRS